MKKSRLDCRSPLASWLGPTLKSPAWWAHCRSAAMTRSVVACWVIYMGVWGIWTHAVLPVDNRLDMGDPENIAGVCELVAGLIGPSICHEDEEALVVLRRPASPEPSLADEHIFRLIREAAATRETAPWSFFVTGPDGARELWTSPQHDAPIRTITQRTLACDT